MVSARIYTVEQKKWLLKIDYDLHDMKKVEKNAFRVFFRWIISNKNLTFGASLCYL